MNVLLVDDKPRNLLALEAILAGPELNLVTASSGAAALKRILEEEFAVILLDVHMPGMNGFELAAMIRERERSRHTPIIFVTAISRHQMQVFRGYSVGAVDYIFKPFVPEILRAKVAVFVDLYRQKEEIERQSALLRELEAQEHRRRLEETKRQAEDALRRRDAILQAVGSAAEQLLRSADWSQGLSEVLAQLGELLAVTRISVVQSHPGTDGERLASLRHEWVATGAGPRAGDPVLQDLPWSSTGLAGWEGSLSERRIAHGLVRDLPAGEAELPLVRDARSLLCVPVFVGTEWWGILSFEDCAADREWSPAELDALKTAADTLGAAIERSHVGEQLSQQVKRLAGLHAINAAINASLDLSVTLDVFLDHVTTDLGVAAAAVLLLNPDTQSLEYAAGRGFRTFALRHTRLHVGEGHAGRAALERRLVTVPDLTRSSGSLNQAPFLSDEGFVAYFAAPLIAKGEVKGVLELLHRAALHASPEWLDIAEKLAGQAAVAIDNATLFHNLQRSNLELTLAYDTTIEGWSRALDLRDRETEGHTLRVTDTTLSLARSLGMSEAELVHLRRGTLLHDIGKLGVPDQILHKPGPLDEDEWRVMRLHPVHAYDLLSPISYLRPALAIPYCHHEWWDGTGYPRGLKAEAIPLAARVFALVDVWDALRSDRPYRPAWSVERVREYMSSLVGIQFDPGLFDHFFEHMAVISLAPPVEWEPGPPFTRASPLAS